MTAKEVIAELDALGTAQNRKIYARHGADPDRMFGVSYANLAKLQKRIKVDHPLARSLWASRNHDSRILACKIADPAAITAKEVDAWSREVGNYIVAGELAALVARTPLAASRRKKWIASRNEMLACAGWHLVALAADDSANPLPDGNFEAYLKRIESTIHSERNFTRDGMNGALIAIGLRNRALEAKAIAAARRIGKVVVDHGETGCKTPDAEAYIRKTLAHRAEKAAKQKSKTRAKAK